MTAKERRAIPASKFALPEGTRDNGGKPAFPTDTPGRARAAKSYASKEEARGDITPSQEKRVDAAADRELGHAQRGTKQTEPLWKRGRS